MLSLVIPSYNEQEVIEEFINTISDTLRNNNIDFQLILVDDGSKDATWDIISRYSKTNDNIISIKLSRNFGKESAIFAGIKYASGDCCIVMDCDLQHPPKTAVEMYNIWEKGDVEVIEAIKSDRGKESFLYKISTEIFYRMLKDLSKIDLKNASDFKLMDKKVYTQIEKMPERQTFFRAMSAWVGFKVAQVHFEVQERKGGTTKWRFRSLVKYAINSITSYTSAPLQLVTSIGLIFIILAIILGTQTLVNKFLGNAVEGYTTMILLMLIIGGAIMISLGIIGFYISKIYEEVKQRPRYIVSEAIIKKKHYLEELTNE